MYVCRFGMTIRMMQLWYWSSIKSLLALTKDPHDLEQTLSNHPDMLVDLKPAQHHHLPRVVGRVQSCPG